MAMNPQNPNSDFDVTAQTQFKDSISAIRFRPVAGQVFLNAYACSACLRLNFLPFSSHFDLFVFTGPRGMAKSDASRFKQQAK
jgi:hypothetical protein